MIETFRSFDLMLQAYWVIAAAASVVFCFQAIMVFIGFDADADVPETDTDFDTDGFHLISVKTIVSFLMGFGWTGVLLWNEIDNRWFLTMLALLVGLSFMCLIAYLLYLVMKLDKDNTFHIKQTVGLYADVYLTIPALKAQTGKVTVSVNGTMHELEALTADAEKIPTGAKVRIVGFENEGLVLVEKA